MQRTVLLASICCSVALLGCPRSLEEKKEPAPDKPVFEKKTVPLKKRPHDEDDRKDEPVYPPDAKPLPVATKLCAALFDLRAKRKAACCGEPERASPLTARCVSSVSAALVGEGLSVDEVAVDRCAAALAAQFHGCDWVRTLPHPRPRECFGLFTGTRKEGDSCRSSLECASGLSCAGVGPMDAGRCTTPRRAGAPCNTAVDPLAGFLGDELMERDHPPCAGYCGLRRCQDAVPVGGACKRSAECGRDAHCAAGKCVAGAFAQAGAACTGGGCEPGTRCVSDVCTAPKPKGASCRVDPECVGACVKDPGAAEGTCGMRCGLGP